jgi:hypothetical protein
MGAPGEIEALLGQRSEAASSDLARRAGLRSVLGGRGLDLAPGRATLGRGGLFDGFNGFRCRCGRTGQEARQGRRTVVGGHAGITAGLALGTFCALGAGRAFGPFRPVGADVRGDLGRLGGRGVALGAGLTAFAFEAGVTLQLAAFPAFAAGLAAAAVGVEAAFILGTGLTRLTILPRLVAVARSQAGGVCA